MALYLLRSSQTGYVDEDDCAWLIHKAGRKEPEIRLLEDGGFLWNELRDTNCYQHLNIFKKDVTSSLWRACHDCPIEVEIVEK